MKSLHLATADDAPKLLALVAAFHSEQGHEITPEHQEHAILPLLDGAPHGAIWLIGPRKSPVGFVVVTFGWSLELGGLEAHIPALYIRPAVRKRGMGGEALAGISKAMSDAGVAALHLRIPRDDEATQRFCQRARFAPQKDTLLLTRLL
ncbi:GNAT family N-acetyltransferase [Tropicibacter naphthalenivorans]|uniref:N-acetyltransferase domain-containing protein n=1 Tax=Tropicibacter naphthalenivorans TaxID=441103 RepID=A0A0P1GLX1_9RHOB|nr:GNAT family N-acetyltransferase [Tropicibacter naphthalenivorans]CUH76831.1 hypothetical protein TRN7648_01148 [Tropicibacter naphthalenivorans]SMC62700.1 hypothetical protein SAMN04488093_102470 [Tropicibacter naphthalenivorans]